MRCTDSPRDGSRRRVVRKRAKRHRRLEIPFAKSNCARLTRAACRLPPWPGATRRRSLAQRRQALSARAAGRDRAARGRRLGAPLRATAPVGRGAGDRDRDAAATRRGARGFGGDHRGGTLPPSCRSSRCSAILARHDVPVPAIHHRRRRGAAARGPRRPAARRRGPGRRDRARAARRGGRRARAASRPSSAIRTRAASPSSSATIARSSGASSTSCARTASRPSDARARREHRAPIRRSHAALAALGDRIAAAADAC